MVLSAKSTNVIKINKRHDFPRRYKDSVVVVVVVVAVAAAFDTVVSVVNAPNCLKCC